MGKARDFVIVYSRLAHHYKVPGVLSWKYTEPRLNNTGVAQTTSWFNFKHTPFAEALWSHHNLHWALILYLICIY